ncbi:MAG: TatD family hydrolase [Candidatus Thorarchaeota archaeon]
MRLFDAHTHLDMKHYQHDLDKVIKRAQDAGVEGMVTCSTGPGSFRRTLGIVDKYKGIVFHTAGSSVSQLTRKEADEIIALSRKYADQLVAVGEVGLDYYWIKDPAGRKAQEPLFIDFIRLAEELHMPIVIHSRKAEAEATDILEREFNGPVLMHCFDGHPRVAQRVADNGWSITLPANFGRYRNRRRAAEIMPLEQILLETDGPYLSPTGQRNEPANVRYGCESLAEIKEIDSEVVGVTTTSNARRFYRL